jgi:hypothetical protein
MINLLLIILLFYRNVVNKTTVEEEVINIGGQSMKAPHCLEAASKNHTRHNQYWLVKNDMCLEYYCNLRG